MSIATPIAISVFDGDALGEVIGVPLYHGLVETVVLRMYWKLGLDKSAKE